MTPEPCVRRAELSIIETIAGLSTIGFIFYAPLLFFSTPGSIAALLGYKSDPPTGIYAALFVITVAFLLFCAVIFWRAIELRRWACVAMVCIFGLVTAYIVTTEFYSMVYMKPLYPFMDACWITYVIVTTVLVARNHRNLKSGF